MRRELRGTGDEEFPNDELDLALTFEYLCTVGCKGYEAGLKVA